MGSLVSDKSVSSSLGRSGSDNSSDDTIDHNLSLYIHPSDNLGLSLVGTVLMGLGIAIGVGACLLLSL